MTVDHRARNGIDLNLLVALDALLSERGVTRAAARIGITQSAMSSSLARLRRLLGDELLTRAADGMRMTPRAAALVAPVRTALREFQGIVTREDAFDPASVERAFAIALPGSVEVLFGPRLLAFLQREAPGLRLTLRPFEDDRVLADLDADRLDLAIGLVTRGQAHHKARPLYRSGYLCLFNADLLGVAAPISLDDYLRFPHIMTSLTGTDRGVVDEALAAIGRTRRLAATTARFVTVPYLVRAAPVITTMVDALATTFARQLGLTVSPVPVPVPDFPISMLWHASYDGDPVHRWMREVLVRLGREYAGAWPED